MIIGLKIFLVIYLVSALGSYITLSSKNIKRMVIAKSPDIENVYGYEIITRVLALIPALNFLAFMYCLYALSISMFMSKKDLDEAEEQLKNSQDQ